MSRFALAAALLVLAGPFAEPAAARLVCVDREDLSVDLNDECGGISIVVKFEWSPEGPRVSVCVKTLVIWTDMALTFSGPVFPRCVNATIPLP